MKTLSFIILILVSLSNLYANKLTHHSFFSDPDSLLENQDNINIGYSIPDSVLQKFPFRNQNELNRFYPGVVSYFQNFYIRGGQSYETGFFLDGTKFNDLYSGENSFFLNPNVFQKIDYYSGYLTANFGHTSSGLFNYKLKTGGDKLNINLDYQTDNITFTDDAFSGQKRLGTYYYGYNETNFNIEGPVFSQNIKFYANVNYLFLRDKNPQRYPGADNLFFYDQTTSDSITLNLPAGIVPLNSFESINLVSTLLFNFDQIKIKASGIYFNENEFTDRHHILDYLNLRAGLIDKTGGIVNLNIDHKIDDILSYSLNGSYGDSVTNAEAGVFWQRDGGNMGRYTPPSDRLLFMWRFRNSGYPDIDHQKSEQERLSLTGDVRLSINNHLIRIGGEFFNHKLRYWQLDGQRWLAREFYWRRADYTYQDLDDEELRDFIAKISGANNIGYDPDGDEINSGIEKAPEPVFTALYVDDQFILLDDIFIYLGLRYDHFEFDYKRMIDPAAPEETFDIFTLNINENGLTDSENYSYFSPKVYIKYSVLNNLSLVVNYSQNVQSHPFSEIYQGLGSIGYNLTSGFISTLSQTQDLEPVVSKQYEISLFLNPINNLNTKVAFYNKRTENQTSLELQEVYPSSPYGSYYYYGDNGTMDIWGLEFLIDYYNNGFNLVSNISYQNIEDKYAGKQFNTIRLNAFFNYNFFHLQKFSNVFSALNLSAMFTFNNGHPYYLDLVRSPVSPFSGTTPNVYQLDLKVDKGFTIFNNLSINLYLYVLNLFDTKNIYDVFPRTGSAEDDGADLSIFEEVYGEQFGTLYNLINQYNPNEGQQTFFGPPRRIGFGIKINY